MWKNLAMGAITTLFNLFKPEMLKDFIDAGLDAIEDKYIEGEVDEPSEVAIRKAIDFVRAVLNIDDKKYGSDKEEE